MSFSFSTAALAALSDRKNWPAVIKVWEGHHPGWHELPWMIERIPSVIAERARMIEASELTPHRPRPAAADPAPPDAVR